MSVLSSRYSLPLKNFKLEQGAIFLKILRVENGEILFKKIFKNGTNIQRFLNICGIVK